MSTKSTRRPSLPFIVIAALLASAAAADAEVFAPNLIYTTVKECRIFDTRSSTAGQLIGGVTQTFNVVGGNVTSTTFTGQGGTNGGCAIPGFANSAPQVQAVAVRLLVVTPAATGTLAGWPSDHTNTGLALINYPSGPTISGAFILPVRQDSQGGDISLAAQTNVDVLGDVMGYFSAESPTPSGGSQNLILGLNAGNMAYQTGSANTGLGDQVLYHNTSGSQNTALGSGTLYGNTTGYGNTAVGNGDLAGNTTGIYNTALGWGNLQAMTTGSYNTVVGTYCGNIGTGLDNILVGFAAGIQYTSSESYNILLGNGGVSGESHVIRIGTSSGGANQTSAYVAGIYGATSSSGTAVYVNSSGQLGTATSSLRFKADVQDMGTASDGLMRLRPVTFHYKPQYDDGSDLLQYGLVAEEVAKVYPGLVQYDEDGKPLAVRYQFVNAMLLNEVQDQHRKIDEQQVQLAKQGAQIEELQRQVRAMLQESQPGRNQ